MAGKSHRLTVGILFLVLSCIDGYAEVRSDAPIRVRILEKYHPVAIAVSFEESIYENHQVSLNSHLPAVFPLQTTYRVRVPDHGIDRFYQGSLSILNGKKELVVINTVTLEEYVTSVVISEMGYHHEEAMCAQAILSRTWAVRNSNPGASYDFCDLTISQSYQGRSPYTGEVKQKTMKTRGLYLTYNGKPADVVYHAGCTDKTLSSQEVWGGDGVPYLASVTVPPEAFGKSGIKTWEARLSKHEVDAIIARETGDTGMKTYTVCMANGQKGIHTGHVWIGIDRFRLAINRTLGWNTLKSNAFTITNNNGMLLVKGRGFGHLVGMCQEQAVLLAEAGWSFREILTRFYPGCEIEGL